jgi:hypothetical protein
VVTVSVLIGLLLHNWETLDDLGLRERSWVGLAFALVFGVWGLLWLGERLAVGWQLHAAGALAVVALSSLGVSHWHALTNSPGDRWLIRTAIALGLVITLWALLWGGRRLGGAQVAWA